MGLESMLALATVALVLLKPVLCQPVAIEGRILSLSGSAVPDSLPVAVSWPASQISATFTGSSSVTAVIKDLTYASETSIRLLPVGISVTVNGAGTPVVTVSGDTILLTVATSPSQSTVTLVKEDECSTGKLIQATCRSHKRANRRTPNDLELNCLTFHHLARQAALNL